MSELIKFSDKLKELRKEHNLTQAQLGELCGISAQEISHFENGRRSPEVLMLVKLCYALDSSPNMLLWNYFDSNVTPTYDSMTQADAKEHMRNALHELIRLEEFYRNR